MWVEAPYSLTPTFHVVLHGHQYLLVVSSMPSISFAQLCMRCNAAARHPGLPDHPRSASAYSTLSLVNAMLDSVSALLLLRMADLFGKVHCGPHGFLLLTDLVPFLLRCWNSSRWRYKWVLWY